MGKEDLKTTSPSAFQPNEEILAIRGDLAKLAKEELEAIEQTVAGVKDNSKIAIKFFEGDSIDEVKDAVRDHLKGEGDKTGDDIFELITNKLRFKSVLFNSVILDKFFELQELAETVEKALSYAKHLVETGLETSPEDFLLGNFEIEEG